MAALPPSFLAHPSMRHNLCRLTSCVKSYTVRHMRRGYIRITKTGPSPDQQRRALDAVGVTGFSDNDPIYIDQEPKRKPKEGVDPLPQRSAAIKALRAGDELVVSNAGRLGVSRDDILAVLAAIGRRRAAVFDAAEGRAFACSPEIADAAEFALLAQSKLQAERVAVARQAIKEFGTKSGPRPKFSKADVEDLRRMWANPDVSVEAVEIEAGVKRRTLYRMLGPRTTPRFGKLLPQKKRSRR